MNQKSGNMKNLIPIPFFVALAAALPVRTSIDQTTNLLTDNSIVSRVKSDNSSNAANRRPAQAVVDSLNPKYTIGKLPKIEAEMTVFRYGNWKIEQSAIDLLKYQPDTVITSIQELDVTEE